MKDFSADVLFIVDASAGITEDNFERAKAFVKKTAAMLNLSPRDTRAGVVTFSSFPKIVVPMGGYKISSFGRAIDDAALHRDGVKSRIDLAFQFGSKELRTPGKNQKKVAVLMISEEQEKRAEPLGIVSHPLRDTGADVFIITIGSKPNIENLLPMVRDAEDIFKVASYQDLLIRNHDIAENIAKKSGVIPILFCTCVAHLQKRCNNK